MGEIIFIIDSLSSMRYIVKKIQYLVYSPFVWLFLRIKGVKCIGRSYWLGFPSVEKGSNSTITIGTGCRFVSRHTGNRLGLCHPCMITTARDASLFIGKGCGFSGVSIWCFKHIHIGDNVRFGANVTIMDGDAHQNDPRAGDNEAVVIKDNVWIGANTIVLKGVTIGKNSLIGAGSIVTKSIPDNVVAAGNPCKVIRELDDSIINRLSK